MACRAGKYEILRRFFSMIKILFVCHGSIKTQINFS